MLKFIIFFILSLTVFTARIEKEFTYTKYSIKDEYSYVISSKQKIRRSVQWPKISSKLDAIQDFQNSYYSFGYLTNYKNSNGTPPSINGKSIDRYGTTKSQAIPLYSPDNLYQPNHYGRDGALVAILDRGAQYTTVKLFNREGQWLVPNRYLKISPAQNFEKVIVVDRKNQHVVLLENVGSTWKVRSMTPATTGRNHPPYSQPTPLGVFVVQQKKYKMDFYGDGNQRIAGFAPYATRFTRGAYLHGVPVNLPRTAFIEYSPSLGTTPRSHMCVRNPTSLAQHIYNWAPIGRALVVVIE